jgi:hypothetical protein
MYIISVLFVLFLLVMSICVSVLIYRCSRSGTLDLHSDQGGLGPAKPSQQSGKPARASVANVARRGCWISLLWERGQDGLIPSSTINVITAQMRHNK